MDEVIQNYARDFTGWYIHEIVPVLAVLCRRKDRDALHVEKSYEGYKQLFIDAMAYTLSLDVNDDYYKEVEINKRYKFKKTTIVRISNLIKKYFEANPAPDVDWDGKKRFMSLCVMRLSLAVYFTQQDALKAAVNN